MILVLKGYLNCFSDDMWKTTSFLDIKNRFQWNKSTSIKPSDCPCLCFLFSQQNGSVAMHCHTILNDIRRPNLCEPNKVNDEEFWGIIRDISDMTSWLIPPTPQNGWFGPSRWLYLEKYWMDNWIVLLTRTLSLETRSSVQKDEKHTSQDLSTLKEVENIYLLESGHLASISQRM